MEYALVNTDDEIKTRTTVYILIAFLLALDLPALVWLLSPSADGDREAIKIVCVVFVGGLVNFFTGLAAWRRFRRIRENWSRTDRYLRIFLFVSILWMVVTFLISYIKQLIIPL